MKKSVSKYDMQRWPFIRNKMMELTPDQGVSIEIKSFFSSKGDKRMIVFPSGS